MKNNFLIPPGFVDNVSFDAYIEHKYKNSIINYFRSNGFDLVKTPLIEYLNDNDENIFTITSKKNEDQLKIRNDITPQIIRLSSSRLSKKERPLKLCYYGEVLRKRGTMLRPERQFLQVGAEIIGSSNIKADVEIINLAYHSLKDIGIKNITIEIASEIFLKKLFNQISNKSNLVFLENSIKTKNISNCLKLLKNLEDKKMLTNILNCTGDFSKINSNLDKLANDKSLLDEIENIREIVKLINVSEDDNIIIDFSEIDKNNYHNGIKFTFYAKDVRGEIARGGRYSIKNNNVEEKAIGFTCYMDTVLRASSFENMAKKILIPYDTEKSLKVKLIKEGYVIYSVYHDAQDMIEEAKKYNCGYYLTNDQILKV